MLVESAPMRPVNGAGGDRQLITAVDPVTTEVDLAVIAVVQFAETVRDLQRRGAERAHGMEA